MTGVRILVLAGLTVLAAGCGSGHRVSSSDGRSISNPAWSPDGKRIAWEERLQIWIANADGTHPRRVGRLIDAVDELRWLTNGELIYEANFRVFRRRLGQKPVLVSSDSGPFSIDARGTRIASGASDCPLCTMPVEVIPLVPGVPRATVGDAKSQNTGPSLAPSGRLVVFARTLCTAAGGCDTADGIWTAPTTGATAPTQLARNAYCPAWSPRGDEIFFARNTGYVIPTSGGAARRLPLGANCATWSPDARALATVTGNGRLAVIDVRTARARLLPSVGTVNSFAWAPGSRTLLVAASPSSNACSSLWLVPAAGGRPTELRRC